MEVAQEKYYKSIVIGAGRIGAGYDWPTHKFIYTHAEAHIALGNRIDFQGIVEKEYGRRATAWRRYRVPVYASISEALEKARPRIVSVCTQPEDQEKVIDEVLTSNLVKGIWCEKPYMDSKPRNIPIQVNYIRRFDPLHLHVKELIENGTIGKVVAMTVTAGDNWKHTMTHFVDLATWLNIPLSNVHLNPIPQMDYVITEYSIIGSEAIVRFEEGGMEAFLDRPWQSNSFPGIKTPRRSTCVPLVGFPKSFMQNALKNLIDYIDGKADIVCPANDSYVTTLNTKELSNGKW